MLRPMILGMIKQILHEIFGGGGLKNMITGGEGTERCPGMVAGSLAFRQVKFTRAATPGMEMLGPKAQARANKVDPVATAVLYVRFVQRFLDQQAWAVAVKQPEKAALELLAKGRIGVACKTPTAVHGQLGLGSGGWPWRMFQLVYQRRRGSTKDYTFRGKATEQNHSIALPLQYGDQQLVLWVRHAPPRKGVPRAAEGNEQEDKAEEGNGDGNAADGRAGEKNNDSSKRAGARSEPAAKRTSGQQRALPDGAVVTPIAKDGNCLFESIAQGLCGLEPRCELASTLEERDGLYEIRAACRIWDFRCIVFPTSECLEPFHVHGHAKKRVVALYFTGHHYDLLGCDNGSLPKSILAIRGSPEAVPMRGGGAHDNDVDSGFLGIWLQTATNREQFGTLWDANSSVALTLGRPDIELDIDEAPQAKKRAVNPALQEDGTYRDGSLILMALAWAKAFDSISAPDTTQGDHAVADRHDDAPPLTDDVPAAETSQGGAGHSALAGIPAAAWSSLDAVDLAAEFGTPVPTMQSVPVHVLALWRFTRSPRSILTRHIGRKALLLRSRDFLAGRWDTLLTAARTAAAAPRAGSAADVADAADAEAFRERRRALACANVRRGEVSRARATLTSAAIATGTDETFAALSDPERRPPVPLHDVRLLQELPLLPDLQCA
ncbi:unnamed protein product, partial [Symbiodinium microadriaticum]